jgi:hypothetical protein
MSVKKWSEFAAEFGKTGTSWLVLKREREKHCKDTGLWCAVKNPKM